MCDDAGLQAVQQRRRNPYRLGLRSLNRPVLGFHTWLYACQYICPAVMLNETAKAPSFSMPLLPMVSMHGDAEETLGSTATTLHQEWYLACYRVGIRGNSLQSVSNPKPIKSYRG